MVILIGGVGYAGKTFLAQYLLEKYKYPYLSIDHLKMGLFLADIGCGFAPTDSVEIIAEKLWPILKGIIMTNIENEQNIIIEGGYLLPRRINELSEEYREKTISFYLLFSEEYIVNFFRSQILGNRCAIEARGYEHDGTMEDYILENRIHKELCQKYGAKFFEIGNDYLKEIEIVCSWIESELSKKY